MENYSFRKFRYIIPEASQERVEVDIIVANKFPERLETLVNGLLATDPGVNVNLYLINGDRPDFCFSKAMNVGLKAGSSPYVLFLNDDTIPDTHLWVDKLVRHLDEFGLVLLGPTEVVEGGVAQRVDFLRGEGAPIAKVNPYGDIGPYFVSGFCVIGRRAQLLEVGGFDENYPYSYEDLDLSLVMGRLGPLGVDLTVWVEHHGSYTDKSIRTKHLSEAGILADKVAASKDRFIKKWGKPLAVKWGIEKPDPVTYFFAEVAI